MQLEGTMISIDVTAMEIAVAKDTTTTFDSVKGYNKFECKHNWIGYLAEMVVNKYLRKLRVFKYKWIQFVKTDMSQPDFIFNNTTTVDIKCSTSDSMWFTEPVFDIYIFTKLDETKNVLYLKSWISKEGIAQAIKTGDCKRVSHMGRNDYVISSYKMNQLDSMEDI